MVKKLKKNLPTGIFTIKVPSPHIPKGILKRRSVKARSSYFTLL